MCKCFFNKIKKISILAILLTFCLALFSCSIIFNNQENSNTPEDELDLSNGVITEGIIEANFTVNLSQYNLSVFGNKLNETISQGSGVIFEKVPVINGYTYYLLTNNHVIYKNEDAFNRFEYSVRNCYGETYASSLVAFDPNYDLAVVSFTSAHEYKVLSFASANPKAGDRVVAIGQPIGIINAVTEGKVEKYMKVSVPTENGKVNESISNVQFNVIKHSAPLNSGSSGGVLLNKDYKICGINFAAAVVEDDTAFVSGYAVPVKKVLEFLTNNFYDKE